MGHKTSKQNAVDAIQRIFAAAREIVEAERALIEDGRDKSSSDIKTEEPAHA